MFFFYTINYFFIQFFFLYKYSGDPRDYETVVIILFDRILSYSNVYHEKTLWGITYSFFFVWEAECSVFVSANEFVNVNLFSSHAIQLSIKESFNDSVLISHYILVYFNTQEFKKNTNRTRKKLMVLFN